ncbi:Thiol-disulfide oxidoreductase ResA [Poriferisphaera corsica]|uniref:Thiol-disulfide oxidoreductase ResA n=1 Tax=Poriferisphaera corsica TaxID=2528020 RepID=A0A517YP50_9BACT|nr:redoxin domain-containing protein [Poriferisphaera corsica]QDU32001.1 Thiol-disulfide oxidoreductase ResA [Poriferisphaera corsica]
MAIKRVIVMVCVVALMLGVGVKSEAAVKKGDKPTFTFTTLQRKKVSLESLRGNIVIIDFWATWCPPCIEAIPHMKAVNKAAQGKKVVLMGVSLDSDRGKMARFVKQKGMDWTHVFGGRSSREAAFFGVNGIPSIYIIDPNGEVAWVGHPANMDAPLRDVYLKFQDQLEGSASEEVVKEVDEETIKAAIAQMGEARKLLEKGDFAKIFEVLSQVDPQAGMDARVRKEAEQILEKLQRDVLNNPEAVMMLVQNPDLQKQLMGIQDQIKSVKEVTEKKVVVQQKPTSKKTNRLVNKKISDRVLAKKLKQAKIYAKSDREYEAYDVYEWLMEKSPNSDAGREAVDWVLTKRKNQKFMTGYEVWSQGKKAEQLLKTGKTMQKLGEVKSAREMYEKVLEECPKAAKEIYEAKDLLKNMPKE